MGKRRMSSGAEGSGSNEVGGLALQMKANIKYHKDFF